MALSKQNVNINFSRGIDTKTDPYQLNIGSFLSMQNSVFDVAGRLTKRNGFANITTLPNDLQTTLTTLNDNLLATGSNLYAFSADTNQWINKGTIQPVALTTQTLVRTSTSQTSPDTAVAASGLTCLVYVDNGIACYQISDSVNGQQVVSRTTLPTGATNPRVFLLGVYFVITFMATVGGAPHFQYIAIPTAVPTNPGSAVDIDTSITALTDGHDGFVANNSLYVAWRGSGGTLRIRTITSILTQLGALTIVGHSPDKPSVTADISGSTAVIWVSWYESGTTSIYTTAYNQALNPTPILAPTLVLAATVINEITSIATAGVVTILYQTANTYTYAPNAITDFVSKKTVTQAGTVSSATVVLRSVGLASKPIIKDGVFYVMVAYGNTTQSGASATNEPTYFLIDTTGNIYMRLAATNAGGYARSFVLPTISILDSTYYVPYLLNDFLAPINKGTNLPSGTPTNAIYTQTGISLGKFMINNSGQYSSETAGALHLTGGQLWEFDGVKPVEHGFQVFPENVASTTATGSGGLIAQTYFYQFTYEWTDNAGNLHRSAPSVPVMQVTTTASSTNTIRVPTLRLTYKIAPNPVRIVGYRWSTAQQVYYQFTSLTNPTLNDPTIDSVTFVDTNSDAAILGTTILYTTGGTVENIAAPSFIHTALFKNRMFGIDSEDPNLLWYSKQVIQNVPVEFSDLFTIFVSPTTGAQGSTGPMSALTAMDDKLIIFKKAAIYYITGTGPDNTGAQNDFSDPIYITASVGTINPSSIVLMPNGVMFQSEKGIWLLGRDLSTTYIGSPVEAYNSQTVASATAIQGTNQVRFIMESGTTLMYDYFYNQWATFTNISAISATLYQGQHTYLNDLGAVYQETPNTYLDGSNPVLMSFTTSWINIAGLQGYERFYFMFLLGTYYTPFKLAAQLAYDYNSSFTQNIPIGQDNFSPPWGGEALWGSGDVWGGPANAFEAQVFPQFQKCNSFQITINEIYDSSLGVMAGAGLALSGLNLVVGLKKGYRTQKASRQFG